MEIFPLTSLLYFPSYTTFHVCFSLSLFIKPPYLSVLVYCLQSVSPYFKGHETRNYAILTHCRITGSYDSIRYSDAKYKLITLMSKWMVSCYERLLILSPKRRLILKRLSWFLLFKFHFSDIKVIKLMLEKIWKAEKRELSSTNLYHPSEVANTWYVSFQLSMGL